MAQTQTTCRLELPDFTPPTLNSVMRGKLRHRMHVARGAADLFAHYAREQSVPPATVKRRVSLHVTLGPRQREFDCDAPWKVTLDALVACGLLVDDSPRWCAIGTLTFAPERGRRWTTVVLEDVPEPLQGTT